MVRVREVDFDPAVDDSKMGPHGESVEAFEKKQNETAEKQEPEEGWFLAGEHTMKSCLIELGSNIYNLNGLTL